MDLGSILLTAGTAALVTLLVVALVAWFVVRRLRHALGMQPAPKLPTPVVDLDDGTPELGTLDAETVPLRGSCEGCRFFNLEAGQRIARAQPAFFQATAHLEPWEMARQRKLEPNPDYERIEALMLAASEAGDVEGAKKLHDELLELNPGELEENAAEIDAQMLGADWTQLGACSTHRELRFSSDVCEKWSGR